MKMLNPLTDLTGSTHVWLIGSPRTDQPYMGSYPRHYKRNRKQDLYLARKDASFIESRRLDLVDHIQIRN